MYIVLAGFPEASENEETSLLPCNVFSLFSLVYSNPLLKKLEAFRLLFTTFPVTPALLKYVLVVAVLCILFYVKGADYIFL